MSETELTEQIQKLAQAVVDAERKDDDQYAIAIDWVLCIGARGGDDAGDWSRSTYTASPSPLYACRGLVEQIGDELADIARGDDQEDDE